MRTKTVRVVATALAVCVGSLSGHALAFAGQEPAPRVQVDGNGRVDPVASALGVVVKDRPKLAQAQDRLVESESRMSSDQQRTLAQVRSEVGAAVDDLYERVSRTNAARRAQASWRTCMKRAGYSYQAPSEIEAAWDQPATYDDQKLTDTLTAAQDRSLKCEDANAEIVDGVVRSLYEGWLSDHAAVFDRYRSQLGI